MSGGVHDGIREYIFSSEPGAIIFPGDLHHLGGIHAVNMSLSRLTKEGVIERLGKGIYLFPKRDLLMGKLHPSLEEIAAVVAQKEQVKIRPTGAAALQKLGLSTQVPMKVVYLTDGNPRSIKIGKGIITFKRTTPKMMAIKGERNFLVVQALITLGKDAITYNIMDNLYNILSTEDTSRLRADAKLAPAWIRQILYTLANKIEQNDGMATTDRRAEKSNTQ